MEKSKVVHVTSQEEWDTVIREVRPGNYYNSYGKYPQIGILLSDGTHCGIPWFEQHSYYEVITFFEWLHGYKNEGSPGTSVIINVPKI